MDGPERRSYKMFQTQFLTPSRLQHNQLLTLSLPFSPISHKAVRFHYFLPPAFWSIQPPSSPPSFLLHSPPPQLLTPPLCCMQFCVQVVSSNTREVVQVVSIR